MSQLQFVNGQTIHPRSRYGDVHTDVNTLIDRIRNHSASKMSRWTYYCVYCLAIDKIGLISQKLFEIIELICRSICKNMFFGGIQIIAAGSFKQLPPVPSFTDPGRFYFQSPIFDSVFPHHMVWDEVVRQHEKDLIKAINEFYDGNPSQETLLMYVTRHCSFLELTWMSIS